MTSLRRTFAALGNDLPVPRLLRWASVSFCLCVLSFVFSVAASQIFFSFAGLCYAADLLRRPRVPAFLPVKLPLALFCFFTALSIGWAENPVVGWTVVRKLTLLFILLFTVNLINSNRQLTAIYRAVFLESALAGLLAVGQFITQYRQVRAQHPGKLYYFMTLLRIHGFQGHWMNFGGQQMLIFVALVAYVTLGRRPTDSSPPHPRPLSPKGARGRILDIVNWIVLAIVAISIVLNFTRGVWLGCGVGLLYLVARWHARWLLALPVFAGFVYLASPSLVRDRVQTLFHPTADPAIAVRIEMWHVGLAMIRRHPLTGVGPNNIPEVYLTYLPPGTQAVPAWHEHLHDVYLQLAAERGLPCLAAWLWFMGALGRQILRTRRRLKRDGGPTWIADASFAGWLAFVVEGFFEFNFGTTPVLMVFLFVISTPFAAERLLASK